MLTVASDRTVLYENVVFSILVISAKKRYSNFFEKSFRFSENAKLALIVSKKTCRSLKRAVILKIPSTIF